MSVRLQEGPFDPAVELADFGKSNGTGARVSFTGVVRDDGSLRHMVIEHYPAMTATAIEQMAAQAKERWSLSDVRLIHRFGRLNPGEDIMMVATAAAHRAEAFSAADFLMDYLKSRAPFWKKEVTETGESWVAAKDQDERALRRWDNDE